MTPESFTAGEPSAKRSRNGKRVVKSASTPKIAATASEDAADLAGKTGICVVYDLVLGH